MCLFYQGMGYNAALMVICLFLLLCGKAGRVRAVALVLAFHQGGFPLLFSSDVEFALSSSIYNNLFYSLMFGRLHN